MDRSSSNRESSGDVPSPSKRLLVKNAWVAPVILAITLPRASYAANVSGTTKQHDNNGNHFGQDKNK
jgi:hypothetical protein